jgi:menaquinone-dependent protoporphyrinogen IX oxidase
MESIDGKKLKGLVVYCSTTGNTKKVAEAACMVKRE